MPLFDTHPGFLLPQRVTPRCTDLVPPLQVFAKPKKSCRIRIDRKHTRMVARLSPPSTHPQALRRWKTRSAWIQFALAACLTLSLLPATLCAPLSVSLSQMIAPGSLSDVIGSIGGTDDGRDTASMSSSGDGATSSASVDGEIVTVEGNNGESVPVTTSAGETTTTETATNGDTTRATTGDAGGTADDATGTDSTPPEDTAPSSDSSGNIAPESSSEGGIVGDVKCLNTVVIAGAASGGVLLLVIIVLVCVWCARIRSARRLASEAIKAGDTDAYVPADWSFRNHGRRDSTPWGHPSAGAR